jgi:V8-like Glu-specific endopeptidase
MRQESVFDEDERQPVEESSALEFIGLIRAKFKSKPTTLIGTGAIISEDLVLTAAHNLCQINGRLFRKYKEYLQSTLASSLQSSLDGSRSLTLEETIS